MSKYSGFRQLSQHVERAPAVKLQIGDGIGDRRNQLNPHGNKWIPVNVEARLQHLPHARLHLEAAAGRLAGFFDLEYCSGQIPEARIRQREQPEVGVFGGQQLGDKLHGPLAERHVRESDAQDDEAAPNHVQVGFELEVNAVSGAVSADPHAAAF